MIVTNYPKDVTLKVNNFCRDLKIKFFAGDIFGYFGYSFMDLVKHDYVEEEVKKVEAGEGKKAKEDEPDAKKAKMVRFLTILDKIILLKYGSEEKGSSLCKCSILLGFFYVEKTREVAF